MAEQVSLQVQDGIAILRMENGPQNTLSPDLRAALIARFSALADEDEVSAVVLTSAGAAFSAGLDIGELGRPVQAPSLMQLTSLLAEFPKPIVAALRGRVLGGAVDLALAAHARVASADTHVGFPAMAMGLLPLGGATQRLPNILPAPSALRVLLGEGMFAVSSAVMDGFAEIAADNAALEAQAVELAKQLAQHPDQWDRARFARVSAADPIATQAALQSARGQYHGKVAPSETKLIECVEASQLLPLAAGLALEETLAEDCRLSDYATGLRHAYLARRRIQHFPERTEAKPRQIRHLGLVGGSANACAIAAITATRGTGVTIYERNAAAVAEAEARVEKACQTLAGRGDPAAALAQIQVTAQLQDLAAADLVLETVGESVEAKQQVFQALDQVLPPDAIRASHSALLPMVELAKGQAVPENFLGLHFHAPVLRGELVELIAGPQTSAETLVTVAEFITSLGRLRLRNGGHPSSMAEPMLAALREVGWYFLLQGISPYAVDQALIDYGLPYGVFAAMDRVGLDVLSRRLALVAASLPVTHATLLQLMQQDGRLGRHGGRGFYLWPDPQTPRPDPELSTLLNDAQPWRTPPKPAEIVEVTVAALANQGAKLLRAGAAVRPSDIDALMVLSQAWPRRQGGPMHSAEQHGMFAILQILRHRAEEVPALFDPDPALAAMVKNGQTFSDLNGIGRNRVVLPA